MKLKKKAISDGGESAAARCNTCMVGPPWSHRCIRKPARCRIGPMNKICDELNRCGKRFEDAMRKTEMLAENVRHHREFRLHIFTRNKFV
ncbi:hypothetical protein ACJRO7_006406 [Eucalyptus globulus]|uniref:Uncharacterized protein n=1 Tax=Eucalyptus globulus TaxID=34317 RepID=A0ABD3ILB9_EUCGL